jgi:hypothetical protein
MTYFKGFDKIYKFNSSILTARLHLARQGPMLWFLKYFRLKIRRKNWRFWLKTKINFEKYLIIALVFEKQAKFFAENLGKLQKIVIITSAPGAQNHK